MFGYLFRIAGLALILLSMASPARAQTTERCFTETGFCISGLIRDYWERNGGLAVFGYPITAVRTELVEGSWTGPVQWFERDRLEDHSNDGQGVLAGRLGAKWLEFKGTPWQTLPGAPGPGDPNTCRFFAETGHILCGKFREYWERNGGLERFGYPITEVFSEAVEGRTYNVQYFERRRMELHPENAGTPYEILLGLLGRDVYTAAGGEVIAPTPGDVPQTIQQPILDAAYAAVRATNPQAKLAVGLVDVVGDYAAVEALPFGQRKIYVFLQRQANTWRVVEATSIPSAEVLRQRGIPEELLRASDRSIVIDLVLSNIQDARGQGMNSYITRPRVSGDWARFWVVPALNLQLDPATQFYRRVGGTWRFETGGSAFPEEQLREMGVPQELRPYGESVRGPQS